MIPHRMLSAEINGSGLKDRVTACRKRLRVNRTRPKAPGQGENEELFTETTKLFSFASSERVDCEALLAAEEEVGIT